MLQQYLLASIRLNYWGKKKIFYSISKIQIFSYHFKIFIPIWNVISWTECLHFSLLAALPVFRLVDWKTFEVISVLWIRCWKTYELCCNPRISSQIIAINHSDHSKTFFLQYNYATMNFSKVISKKNSGNIGKKSMITHTH